jgi:opacity protein-like surface antigen
MRTASAIVFVVAALAPAAAQSAAWSDRGYASVNGFYQATSSFSDLERPIVFAEAAQVDARYGSGGIPGFDAGGGVRLWRNLALGVDVGWSSKSGSASIDAQMPHPLYFNRARTVSGDAASLTHSETAVNVEALLMLPLSPRWQAAVFGGPTWFHVDRDLVTTVTVTESYPFDTATFAGAPAVGRSGSKAGFNVGGDVSYMLRPHVGLGFNFRYSRADVPLTGTVTVTAGGPHVGGGIRFRF